MGLKEFRIYFDNPVATYYGGDQISGKVVIKIDAPKRIRSISTKFKGEASVKWTETEQRRDKDGKTHTEHIHYTANEDYFESTHFLSGGQNGDFTLQPGEHTYNFSITLPNNLPSSFEGIHGHVRYTVKAKIDRPWKFDHEAKAAFTVLSHLDLNLDPILKEPVSRTAEKTLCCCCCQSGPLTLVANVPATGFVPGQEIPITVEIDNASNTNINGVTCSLKKNVHYHARSPHHKEKTVADKVTTVSFGRVSARGSETWMKKLKIPALPPTNLKNCSIIDVKYLLVVKAVVDGVHSNLHLDIPVTIGTIPLLTYIPPGLPVSNSVTTAPVASAPSLGGVVPQPPTSGLGWSTSSPNPFQPMLAVPSGFPVSSSMPQPMVPMPSAIPYPLTTTPISPEKMAHTAAHYPLMMPTAQMTSLGQHSSGWEVTPPQFSAITNQPGSSSWILSPPHQANVAPTVPSAPYPDIPPPTYEECMDGTRSIQDDGDNKHTHCDGSFAPRYPTYSLNWKT